MIGLPIPRHRKVRVFREETLVLPPNGPQHLSWTKIKGPLLKVLYQQLSHGMSGHPSGGSEAPKLRVFTANQG